ncbi:hypothetical protein SAMN04489860_0825 [Paraoerskovia marina]|uniref:Methyltransferase domain-containing protein n=1 Tax=Paraoerskovia marina TaxID=545619 RepID=A0A1H1PJT3_9CELL|nr:class I SAM-dependent methyltransferase [Paraoerskovia marina]SDS11363.1 hypothetical protein SAMN04489860_0825 [Paraoerskovia marina]
MKQPATWAGYRQSIGDRSSLFAAVHAATGAERALYPGSYLDLAPSTALPSVTYLDMDRRAAKYFADPDAVAADLDGRAQPGAGADVQFVAGDYTAMLPLPDAAFDLLISLYAGPIWDHCQQYVAPGGYLLSNASHGDASIAALDPRLTLTGVVQHASDTAHTGGTYTLSTDELDTYLVPKKPATADADQIRASGKGIAYTREAFAYLFQLDARG